VLTVVAFVKCDIKGLYVRSMDPVAVDFEHSCFSHAMIILGTAWVLELFNVFAITFTPGAKAIWRDFDKSGRKSRWHDSQLMLYVYSVLFTFYTIMALGSFGIVHIDPFGGGRPVYSLRFVEWSIAVPVLMSVVGRSVPRSKPAELWPAILCTVVYIYASLLALIITDYRWRIALIVVSFVGYAFAAWDQMNWARGFDRTSPNGWVSVSLLAFQVSLFGVYGCVYSAAAWDIMTPSTEQLLYTFGDATAKVMHSALLMSMRQQSALGAIMSAKKVAAAAASDLSRLVDKANAPIISVDQNGDIVIWNSKVATMTGYSAADAQGRQLLDLVGAENHTEIAAVLQACAEGKEMPQFHLDLKAAPDADGTARSVPIIINATPQRNEVGAVVGAVGVGQDLTEVTHYRSLEEKKSSFMAMVSHELRSPLHGMIGLASGLAKNEPDDKRKQKLEMVRSCSTRLLDLVTNIMEMSSMTSDRRAPKPLARDPVALPNILEEVCTLISNATDKACRPLKQQGVKLLNTVPDDLPIIEGDAYKLTQVFFNLVTNACKFCPKGRITLSARVNTQRMQVEVDIADTGIGIAPDAVKRIFEPFEQEEASESRNFEGVGLGLAISREMVRRHNGDILVRSVLGQGSTFTVCLPCDPAFRCEDWPSEEASAASHPESSIAGRQDSYKSESSKQQAEDSIAASRSSSKAVQLMDASSTRKPVILSVDDDFVNQEVIQSCLGDDYTVHVAMDGFEALQYFAKNSRLPDVVLLDIMMPGMSGYEVCDNLRQQLGLSPTILPVT
jgi:PAS domain S-box-containing protein